MTIVSELRRMVAVASDQYMIDTTTYWTDDQLSDVLDKRVCTRYLQAEIDLLPTISEGGHLEFRNGQIRVDGTLDTSSVKVVTFGGAPIEGTTVYSDGRIEFDSDQATHIPLLSGLAYDLNGAAADVLTAWASAVQLGYDVTADGQTLNRSQRHAQLLKQAQTFRARAVIGSIHMSRSDVVPSHRRTQRSSAIRQAFDRLGRPG